jgi:4a-hydroxytetrahydrobiopterin dehydratase
VTVPDPLTADQITTELAKLDGWTGDSDEITKTFAIDYHTGIRIVVDVARTAKEVGHHPDIDIRWDTLRFGITTHDAGHKVTVLDFDLAQRIDTIAANHGATFASG